MKKYATMNKEVITSEALRAHNKGREFSTFNENYNKAYKLGSHRERLLLEHICHDKHGFMNCWGKITPKDIQNYYR